MNPRRMARLRELDKIAKKYSDSTSDFISKEIKHLMNDKGYDQERAIAAAHEIARKKGYKVPFKNKSKKSEWIDFFQKKGIEFPKK